MTGSTESPSGSSTPNKKVGVLFVCLGNICRSTMAEGVFRHLVKQHPPFKEKVDWKVDSCGTASYHVGDTPDNRTMLTLKKHGVANYTHKGKCVNQLDLSQYDYILAMDEANLSNLQRDYGNDKLQIMLFGQFDNVPKKDSSGDMMMEANPPIIDDPYYGSSRGGFEQTFQQCKKYSGNLLEYVFDDLFQEKIDFPADLFT